jgi:hypothetical protein
MPTQTATAAVRAPVQRDYKVVHVFVALADNDNQGIVKVPPALGNGQDPNGNLYWGAMYGVRTFFSRSPHWTVLPVNQPREREGRVLQRALFRGKDLAPPVYVLAEAYDGAEMKVALADFLQAAAGWSETTLRVAAPEGATYLRAGGSADLVCFIGHNGLMDLRLDSYPEHRGQPNPKAAVVLACKSAEYFAEPLRKAKCRPLVTTTGLMAPEAYTLDAIVRSWAEGEPPRTVRGKAAEAYDKYQKCGLSAAERLFATPDEPAPTSSRDAGG